MTEQTKLTSSKSSWVMRVELHLPPPEQMPNDMLEMAAAIAWVNYRVEGKGWLWLLVNLKSAPKYMYLSQAQMQKMAALNRTCHRDLNTYTPTDELLLSVTPNWEVFSPDLIGENEYHYDYKINLKERVGKSGSECWQVWGARLGAVGPSGTLTTMQ